MELWWNQREIYLIESRIFKKKVYGMMYQRLASIGAILIERRGEMFSQNSQKLCQEETLEQNDGGTRGQ